MNRPSQDKSSSKIDFNSWWALPIYLKAATLAFGLLLLLSIYTVYQNIQITSRQSDTPNENVQILTERAEDSINSAQLVLSFLEGAAILVGIIAGAAALYGFGELNKLSELRKEIDQKRELLEELDQLKGQLESRIDNVGLLLQADQEFRLQNYKGASLFAQNALRQNPRNLFALYIQGWLEVHHLDNLDTGIYRLRRVNQLLGDTEWASAKAVYGVALRRKGREMLKSSNETHRKEGKALLREAEVFLIKALQIDPKLMDFNAESFWGPVGGIRRELQDYAEAIEAYEEALKVTPMSSYPHGNLSALYLRLAQRESERSKQKELLDKAMRNFKETIEIAMIELSQKPSDYYLLMDLAMSHMIMAYQDTPQESHMNESERYLKLALEKSVSAQTMKTSLEAGWQFLLDSCPNTPEWQPIRTALTEAIQKMQVEMEKLPSAQKQEEDAKEKATQDLEIRLRDTLDELEQVKLGDNMNLQQIIEDLQKAIDGMTYFRNHIKEELQASTQPHV
jgi:tetratricopeptide (TPR) repeat protein